MNAEPIHNQVVADDAYEVGLSRLREAVISSHFMHRISQNSELRFYDESGFATRRIGMSEAVLNDSLLPILKRASEAYCRHRVDAARRRARAHFADFGCGSEAEVGTSEFITEAIFDKEFSRSGLRYNEKSKLNQQVKSLLRERRPIDMVIPALPFKIPSPLKARGARPDLGEVNFLLTLYEIARVVDSLRAEEAQDHTHEPVTFTVISDGRRFNEIVNTPGEEIERYQSALADWVQKLGIHAHVRIVDYKSLLGERLSQEERIQKDRLYHAAYADYSRTLGPLLDPYDVVGSLEAAARVELDPETENPQGRFVSLVKSLVFTLNYRTLQNLDGVADAVRAELYRELSTQLFHPYALIADSGSRMLRHRAQDCESRADLSPEFMEGLRQSMLHEVWEAAIRYISEIKSDRDQQHDPILSCLPGRLRWTIHRKRGQIAIATPPILGMAVQAWAGSGVFRPARKGRIRLCSLPVLLLEATEAIPVMLEPEDGDNAQPLFYIDKQLGVTDIDGLLAALEQAFTRQRFS